MNGRGRRRGKRGEREIGWDGMEGLILSAPRNLVYSGVFRNLKMGDLVYISGVHFQKCSNISAFFRIKY